MGRSQADKPLSQEQRLEIFRALMEAQEGDTPTEQTRKAVAERFGISQQQVRHIEQEGLDELWPLQDLPAEGDSQAGPPRE